MKMSRNEVQPVEQNAIRNMNNIEIVEDFKYLGTILTARNKCDSEVLARIAAGNRCLYGLMDIMKRRRISRTTKLRIYNTIIRPVTLYGCEAWTLTQRLENKLMVFENNILRRITGPVFDEGEGIWRRKHNFELREITKQPMITDFIKAQRIRWAEHGAHMEEGRVPKMTMEATMEGRRLVGRPRMRWRDNLAKDLRELGMEDPQNTWLIV